MTASSQFGEFELDRSRFELLHKGDNSRLVGNPSLTRLGQTEKGENQDVNKTTHPLYFLQGCLRLPPPSLLLPRCSYRR